MFCFRFKIHLCADIVRKIILSNISRCIDSSIVGPNICQVSVQSGTYSQCVRITYANIVQLCEV